MKVLTLFTGLIILLGAAPIRSQNQDAVVTTNMVTLNVAVRDGNGQPVADLTREHFEVFDNEVRQTIEHFSQMSAGVTFGIVYDMHPTTSEQTKAVLSGLRNFTGGLLESDDFFLILFNERGSLSTEVIPDIDQLERHLARPDKREPRSLYDALKLAVGKLHKSRNLKRSLLVITDAADHNSRCSFAELRGTLAKLDVQVYAITPAQRLPDSFEYENLTVPTSDATSSDRAALNSITMRSGGGTFPTQLANQGSVLDVLQRASSEMRNSYSISFYPTTQPDGKWHSLKIRLTRSRSTKGFVLTYRTGYQAGTSEIDLKP